MIGKPPVADWVQPAVPDSKPGLLNRFVLEVTGACWLTVKDCPAIVRVPVRAAPELAATEYDTVPLPLPLLELVIHEALLVVDQAHPEVVVTASVPEVAPEPTVTLVGESE